LKYRQIEHKYTKALKAAQLPFSATHILRHASLTEFYDTCKDLKVTAKVAGHGDVKSTARYAKARDERVTQTQKQMDHKLSSLI
jgi:site-specific recombinase XerD